MDTQTLNLIKNMVRDLTPAQLKEANINITKNGSLKIYQLKLVWTETTAISKWFER